jgi:glycosyltransferase involved in cell wall biosynthesis
VGGGGVIRPLKLAKYLPRFGWQVTVLCSDERLANAYDESLLDEVPRGVRVIRTGPALAAAGGSVVRTARERFGRTSHLIGFLRNLRGALRALWAIPDHRIGWALSVHRRTDPFDTADAIISTGPPHSTHIGAALMARRLRKPLVLDFRDEWVLNPFYSPRIPGRGRLEAYLERWCLRRCSIAVFVSHISCERYSAAFPELAHKFRVIPNGYDPADFAGLDLSREAAGSVVRIGYAGSLDHRRDGAPFFRALGRRLRRRQDPDVTLTMVGPISPGQRKLAEAEIPGEQLEIKPFLPHREALAAMLRCDVLLVVTNTEEAGPAALTGKIFEYLAMHRPILVVAHPSAATTLVDGSGAGVWADPADPGGLDGAIEEAVRLARQDSFTGMDGSELNRYDREKQAGVWDGLLREVVGMRSA